MPIIVIQSGPVAGSSVEIVDSGLLIGRDPGCALYLDDRLVSSHHARIERDNGRWILRDLESSNGTLLNGKNVANEPLSGSDIIEIGETRMLFELEAVATAPPPERRKPEPAAAVSPEPAATREPKPKPRTSAPSRPLPQASANSEDVALVEKMSRQTEAIRSEVGKVVIGQHQVLDEVLMCMIAGGHALLVGLPGLAKTLMISTIAKVVDLSFRRIQFTPDLMPSDITGTEILETNRDTQEKEFRFIHGPIFCNLLLADEINRTPPKTQAALLEAMQEKHVTVGNETFKLDRPFFVLATQNPIEQEGTYPLPEAQMDRFMFNIYVDYPSEQEEERIVTATTVAESVQPEKVLSKQDVLQLQDVVRKIPVSEHVVKYAVRLVRATRPGSDVAPDFIGEFVSIGAGPRAAQSLILAGKARAVLEGRIHVSSKDIRAAAAPVLRHRVYTNFAADSEGLSSVDIVNRLMDTIGEPTEEDYGVPA